MSARDDDDDDDVRQLLAEALVNAGPIARAAARMALAAANDGVGWVRAFAFDDPEAAEYLEEQTAALLRNLEPRSQPQLVALAAAAGAARASECNPRRCEREPHALMAIACAREVFRLRGLRGPTVAELLTAAGCACDDFRRPLTCDPRCGCPCHKDHDS